jgi:hypothetical protein
MRLRHWMVGVMLGAVAGASALIVGMVALLVLVPGLVWAAREPTRPLGLAGLLVGIGVGAGGLLAAAGGGCDVAFTVPAGVSAESCYSVDLTPYLAVALLLVVAGAVLTGVGLRRTRGSAMRVSVGLGVTVIVVSVALWVFFDWVQMASGLSSAMSHPVRPGEVIGAWGQALATIAFIAGWALLAIALWRRRHAGPYTTEGSGAASAKRS